ncbi:Ohr family peroxiredoxin [Nitrogeniibacter mangrovi]|uniref:Ohr family peroxiredoxin n=1 Tax=Nitrogeniibacter mangrovi TaxID=2016596 RepID=A0A6C1B292_9RHOO|nr:Ohr family peroxiredoxin [Nitrogeniibacter mangrovi]QID16948.1 Ohr family peroxiredoxin [Nitrogeniibacter mangrovi]
MDQIEPVFTATATARGGRNGQAETADGSFGVRLSVPKAMGGPGASGAVTPEDLFAAGYAACFGGAIDFVAQQRGQDASQVAVTCAVSIGGRDKGGFGLEVKFRVEDSQLAQADLEALVKAAHEEICPYSHATRNNVPIAFEVVGR